MSWTSPRDLREQLDKRWRRGDILRARLGDEPLFPLQLRLRKPAARDLTEHFADVADWVSRLRDGSKQQRGYGYTIHWQPRRHRVQGSNDMPHRVTVDTEDDALQWLGHKTTAARFDQLARSTLARFPVLRDWLHKRPLRMLEYESVWGDVLTVLAWFEAHPRPGVYLRELEIPGIHTKFIEAHRGLLAELLDAVLPAQAIVPEATGVRGFNRRYGLRDKPPVVRFRLLDKRLAVHGMTDLSVPAAQLAGFDPGADTVFVAENEINGLAFPAADNALVIFGLGYGVDVLQKLPWLAAKRLYYWGDIDTHGFAILNRFRQSFPQARSLLMDSDTVLAHRAVWGSEPEHKRFDGELSMLTEDEQALYQQLRNDELAPRLRLEQEHIGQRWLLAALLKRVGRAVGTAR